jgi:hypothetical protein
LAELQLLCDAAAADPIASPLQEPLKVLMAAVEDWREKGRRCVVCCVCTLCYITLHCVTCSTQPGGRRGAGAWCAVACMYGRRCAGK